jgi:hypothetical protein
MDKLAKFLNDPVAVEQFKEALLEFNRRLLALGVALGEAVDKMYGLDVGKDNIREDHPRPIIKRRNNKQARINENEKKLPAKLRKGW